MNNIHIINNEDEWNLFVNDDKNKNNLIIVQFSTSWCGPCKKMKPFVEQLSLKENVNVCKIDVDVAGQDMWDWATVDSLPTFRFVRNGEVVGEYVGSDENRLIESLNRAKM